MAFAEPLLPKQKTARSRFLAVVTPEVKVLFTLR